MTPAEVEPLLVSLRVAAWGAVAALPAALFIGWLLTLRFPGRVLVEAAVLSLLVMPPMAVGIGLLRLGSPDTPLGGILAARFGALLPAALPWATLAVVSLPFLVYGVRGAFRATRLTTALAGSLAGLGLAVARGIGEIGATLTFAGSGLAGQRTLPMASYVALQAPDGAVAATRLALVAGGVALVAALAAALLWRLDRPRGARPPVAPSIVAADTGSAPPPPPPPPPAWTVSGVLREQQLIDGLSRIETGCGALWVPRLALTVGSAVTVRIAAADVVLAATPVSPVGVVGVLDVRVRSVTPQDSTFVDVTIDSDGAAGDGALTIRTTSRVQRLLALEPGRPVVALVRDASAAPAA